MEKTDDELQRIVIFAIYGALLGLFMGITGPIFRQALGTEIWIVESFAGGVLGGAFIGSFIGVFVAAGPNLTVFDGTEIVFGSIFGVIIGGFIGGFLGLVNRGIVDLVKLSVGEMNIEWVVGIIVGVISGVLVGFFYQDNKKNGNDF